MTLPTLTELDATHGFTAGDLQTTGYFAVIPAFQTVYFADGRATGYHKLHMADTRLRTTADPSWTAGDSVDQVGGGEGTFMETVDNGDGTYDIFIYRTSTTEFSASINATVSGKTPLTAAQITTVHVPPFWSTWTPTTGSLPTGGANIGCLYNGRIVLNNFLNPNQWIMSRMGDPLDFDTSQDDVGAAISSQNSKAGLVGDSIAATIPYQDHYLVYGCVNEMWIMRGDPGQGASLSNLSTATGIFGPESYCWDDTGNLYFMGNNGLYVVGSGVATTAYKPENLTYTRTPNLIKSLGMNRRTDRVVMGFDKDRHGICMTAVQRDGAWSASFFFDLRTQGLFPEKYPSNSIPASMLYLNARASSKRKLLVGGQDGYVRCYDDTVLSDNNGATDSAIEAWAVLGPAKLSKETRGKGRIKELSVRTSENTDSVDVSVYTADAAETLVQNIEDGATTFNREITTAGRANCLRPRKTGAVYAVKVENSTTDETFALEKIGVTIEDAGKLKGV